MKQLQAVTEPHDIARVVAKAFQQGKGRITRDLCMPIQKALDAIDNVQENFQACATIGAFAQALASEGRREEEDILKQILLSQRTKYQTIREAIQAGVAANRDRAAKKASRLVGTRLPEKKAPMIDAPPLPGQTVADFLPHPALARPPALEVRRHSVRERTVRTRPSSDLRSSR